MSQISWTVNKMKKQLHITGELHQLDEINMFDEPFFDHYNEEKKWKQWLHVNGNNIKQLSYKRHPFINALDTIFGV